MKKHNYSKQIQNHFSFLSIQGNAIGRFCIAFLLLVFVSLSYSFGQATVQTFSTSGSFTVPAGVTSITVECWGGGGGGGGSQNTFLTNRYGGGGGGGGYSKSVFSVAPGQSITITSGAGGTVGSNANGGAGGTSTATNTTTLQSLSAGGGGGGIRSTAATGGAAGVGNNFNGGAGGTGTSNGAGGGGAAGSNANGNPGTNTSGGTGGAGIPNIAPFIGGNGGASQNSATNNGNAGISPGGGGGGGKSNTGTSSGGAGATGQIVVSYTIPNVTGFTPTNGCAGSTITINGTNFTGATASNVTIGGTPVSSITSNTGTQIVAVIGSGTTGTVSVLVGGNTGTSSGTFTINLPASVTGQPGAQSICEFQNATYTVVATGGGLTYQWQEQVGGVGPFNNISNGGVYSGALSASLLLTNPPLSMSTNNYRCVVSGPCGSPDISSPALLTISPTPVISASISTQTVCSGNPITDIAFSDINGASSGGSSLSWTRNTPPGITGIASSGSSNPISGAFASTNSSPTLITFSITGTLGSCTSAAFLSDVTVNPGVAIITDPGPAVICQTYDASFSVSVAGGGITYQWHEQVGGAGPFSNLSDGGVYGGVNTSFLQLTNPAIGASGNVYHCVVNSACGTLTSATALLTINPTPSLSITPASQFICSGATISPIVIVDNNGLTAGSTVNWNSSYDANISGSMGASGSSDITGTISNTNAATNGNANFSITATYAGCTSQLQSASVTVSPNIIITSQPQSATRCSNTSTASFSMSATGLPTLTYQWEEQVGGVGPFNTISNGGVYSGATTTTLTLTNPPIGLSGNHYRCMVSGTCGPVSTNGASTLIINPQPIMSVTPSPAVNCSGAGASLVASSSVGGTSYSWSPTTALNPPAGNSANEIASPVSATTYTVTGTATGCSGSTTVTVNIGTTPNATTATPTTSTICPGNIKQLTAGGGQTGSTILLDGTAAGGFENATSTFAANGWIQVGTTAPTWYVGTAAGAQNGTKAAFYGSSSSTYGTTSSSSTVSHFYRDVAIPSGATNVLLNYQYKMPTTDNSWDYFYVHTGSASLAAPVTGSVPSAYTQQFSNTGTIYSNYTAMPSINLTSFAGSTVRIIFSISTDGASPYANPAIDNVSLTATPPAAQFVWAPLSGLYNDAGASSSYLGNPQQVVYASPTATTTYTVTSTNGQGCSTSATSTVNYNTLPPAISSYSGNCSNQTLTVNGSNMINVTAGTIDGISVTPTVISNSQVTMVIPSSVSGTNIPVTLTSSCGTGTDNTLSVNPTPDITATPATQTKCTGAEINQILLTNPNNIPGTIISWSRTTPSGTGGTVPLSGSGAGPLTIDGLVTSTNAVSTPIVFTVNAIAAGCTTTTTSTVTMSPALAGGLTPNASPSAVCIGSPTSLSATAGNQPVTTILSQNFNSAPAGWTKTNTSVGGTIANADWTLRANGYTIPFCSGFGGMEFQSNDATQFYLTSSNQQAGTTTNTTLESPSFSTVAYTTASLNFYHYFNTSGTATVEVSTNGGGSWTTVQTYTTLQGSPSGTPGCFSFPTSTFVSTVVNLNAYINNPSVKVRFHYVASGTQTWWAIDNVVISGAPLPSFSWTSIPVGFTSNEQIAGPAIPPVNPTTYIVTATNTNVGSCAISKIDVSLLPLPSVAATNNSPFCSGTQDLILNSNAPTATGYLWTGPGGYSSPSSNPVILSAPSSASGNYKLRVTDSNGCRDSILTFVDIYELPTIGIVIIGNSNVCSGQSTADLQATGANSYLWNTSENTSLITVSTAGNYAVTGTDLNGCINSQSQTITESFPPVDPVISPAGTSTLCINSLGVVPITLSCTNYSSDLLWSTSEVTPDIEVDYEDIFNVTYTDLNGCFSTSAAVATEYDQVDPIITCPADVVTCSTTPALGTPVTSDNCSVATVTNDAPAVFPVGNTDVTWTVTDYNSNSATCIQHVTVQTASSDPVSATGNAPYNEICLGGTVTLSVGGGVLGTGASWVWYDGGCGTGGSVGTGSSIILTPSAGLHQYFVRAEGACGNTACAGVNVNVVTAPPPGTIHYTSSISDGCVGSPATAFTVNAVAGCTFYNWSSSQSGVRFDGNASPYQTTVPTVNVTFVSLPPAGSSGWSICVAGGNACGNTNTICTWVRASLSTPGSVAGSIIGCPGTSGNPYSSASVAGAASYQWSSTGGITVTGNGAQSVTVAFSAGFVSGTLSVHGQTICGYSGPDRTISIARAPAIPGVLSGPSYPCPNGSSVYSVALVNGAANYTWSTTVPGAIVTGTSNSCSIAFPAIIPAGSIVSVTANSSCPFSSPVRSKGIASGIPGVPANINGPASGQCGETGVSYSITPVALATGYNWTTTCGTIQGPNNLSGITVDWPGSFNFCTITVAASNVCGTGISRSLNVLAAPATPVSVIGNASPCAGSSENYAATSLGATSYNWTIPAGSVILGPANGSSIILQWGSTSGNVSVQAVNSCGSSGVRSLPCTISCRLNQIGNSLDVTTASVYPNPTKGKTNLVYTCADRGNMLIQISDVAGRNLLTENVNSIEGVNLHELDLSSFSKGIYLIQLTDENRNEVLRISVD